MIQTVIKRDGRVVGYNEEKIKAAIRKAMLQTEMGEDESLLQKIADRIGCTGNERMTVEEIQDRVELELMNSPRKEVAKRYIAYRDQRSIARRAKTRDMFLEIIEAKSNDITRENANMNTDSPAGMMMKFASETTKPFVDDYLLSQEARDAVKNGYLHIHDKDYYPTKSLTCVQHPLDRILNNGFMAGHSESRPAKRIEKVAFRMVVAFKDFFFNFFLIARFFKRDNEIKEDMKMLFIRILLETEILQIPLWIDLLDNRFCAHFKMLGRLIIEQNRIDMSNEFNIHILCDNPFQTVDFGVDVH